MKAYAFLNENGEGMTLRDWFAGQALASIVHDFASPGTEDEDMWSTWVSRVAYQVADDMMKRRNYETAQN